MSKHKDIVQFQKLLEKFIRQRGVRRQKARENLETFFRNVLHNTEITHEAQLKELMDERCTLKQRLYDLQERYKEELDQLERELQQKNNTT